MDECTDETLVAAKRVLSRELTAFGLSERFDESLILFRRRLGWGNVFYSNENPTRDRPHRRDIPNAAIRTIESNNARDLELYQFALRRFDEVIAGEGPDLHREVRAFRRVNRVRQGLGTLYRVVKSAVPRRVKELIKRCLGRAGT